jgi:response regulator RpfG family c-di-GMP phosphodiesterase
MNLDGLKILSIDASSDELARLEKYAVSLALEIDSFSEPEKALDASQEKKYDLLIVDFDTPRPDGLDFVRLFRQKISKDIPIIMLISQDDIKLQAKALHLGVHEFLTKPVHASLFQSRIFNALKLAKAQKLLEDETLRLQESVANATQVYKEGQHEALEALGVSMAMKDRKDSKQPLRIAHYAKLLAKASGMNEKLQDTIFYASQSYDIGKLAIADELLHKSEKLSEDEFTTIKEHARKGFDMLKWSQSEYLKAAAVICYSHHEKYDGSGYPIGLVGETIPLPGRIVAIADVFDALTTKRSYKEAWSIDDACHYLMDEKEKHFDPALVDLFMENLDAIKAIQAEFSDEITSP